MASPGETPSCHPRSLLEGRLNFSSKPKNRISGKTETPPPDPAPAETPSPCGLALRPLCPCPTPFPPAPRGLSASVVCVESHGPRPPPPDAPRSAPRRHGLSTPSRPARPQPPRGAGASLTNGEAEPLFAYPPAAGTSPREKHPSGPPAGPQPGRPRPSSRCRAACVSSPRALGPGPFSGAPFANVCAHPVTRSLLCGGFLFLCRAKARRNFTAGEITTDIYFLLNSIRKPFRAAASGQVPPRVGARRERNGVSAPIDRRPRPLFVDVSNLYNKPVLV